VPNLGQKRERQVFVLGVKLLVSAVILCYSPHQRLGIMRIRDAWHSPVQLWAAVALLLLVLFVLTLRWQGSAACPGIPLSCHNMLSMTSMVFFLDTILPGGAADVIRGYFSIGVSGCGIGHELSPP